ncbi:ferredoxin reductase family protein [Paraburkholderia atlantica]|uniref:ferredoxin reductase family protein n=1 Tax=Paraburkholderia atlantica TaxID=2654982 RepID=UPI0016094682|nr:ferric reductase-like transmembrane domain-containing protein [Paraburkholderia atlantica]MBB5509111.1 putative ferric reductase [Paraburkholderia atlantica]
MRKIKWTLWLTLAVVTLTWLASDTPFPRPVTVFSLRPVWTQYTGLMAIAAMSVALVLANRPRWLEKSLDGLDKMYRLHKWLGIAGLTFAVLHWLLIKGVEWAVRWGWLARPPREPRAPVTSAVQQFLRDYRGLAESGGEYAFYAAVVLIVLALIRQFPYRWFAKTHNWLAVLYLPLAFHTVVLLRFGYWRAPVGVVVVVLLAAGIVSVVRVLGGHVGRQCKVEGRIASLTWYPELRVLQTAIDLRPGWPGHASGQFAFVTSDRSEGAHPYTIASAWNPRVPRVVFLTKELGDHTSRLKDRLREGMPVTVEGPYGCFTFADQRAHQIWIGAGIGITPFVARMKELAQHRDRRHRIDLFHSTADFSQKAIDQLVADAKAAEVQLHLLVDAKHGRLNGERVRTAIPDWASASVWFCGPPAFGEAVRDDLVAHGLDRADFHQELFQMR